MTVDGRYSVCRVNRGPVLEYRAIRRGNAEGKRRDDPLVVGVEIDYRQLPRDATDEQRLAAIVALQHKCAEHAGQA